MHSIVRFSSDLSTKSPSVQKKFHRILFKNARTAFKEEDLKDTFIKEDWGRFHLISPDPRAPKVLERLFGVHSFVQVDGILENPTLTELCQLAQTLYGDLIRGRTFAIKARRVGHHSFTSMELNQALGAAVNHHREGKVDLKNPEILIIPEVVDQKAYLYTSYHQMKGPGGLPLGSAGPSCVCLMSGGFDSPLAAWMMMKRGVKLNFVFCNVAGAALERSVLGVARTLVDRWGLGQDFTFHTLDFLPIVHRIKEVVPPPLSQLVLKRFFYRAADAIAKEHKAMGLVTGEALGQVSSQTLPNLRAIDSASELPVFRPLIGFDKIEITNQCKKIGTFQVSSVIPEHCQLVQDKPATGASLFQLDQAEALVERDLLTQALLGKKTVSLKALSQAELSLPFIFKKEPAPQDILMDIRPADQYQKAHLPGALSAPLEERSLWEKTLDKKQSYVFCCQRGMESALLAEELQRKGFEAYSLEGGIR
jgi:thiamine biosynthesis protein ThiI